MRLKYQIFLTLLAASALLVLAMYVISSWSFSRGFIDYVNQNEISRLSPIAERLVYEYEQNGRTWDWVDASDLRQFNPGRNSNGKSRQDTRQRLKIDDQVNGPGRAGQDRPPSPAERSGDNSPQTRRSRERRPGPKLVLVDENKSVLVGRLNPKATMQWVDLTSNDQTIAYLGFPRNPRVDRHFDKVFEDKQKKTFGWTALAMILFSALLSIPLADRIVRPLLKLNKAVDEISGGNYAHRLDSQRKDELGDLASNINTLGMTLEKNRDARQRWIAEISHELRTPLAIMRGEIEAVQDGVRVLDKVTVNSLHSEVMSLGRLINDLHTLSMSDVGALNYQMEALDLSELLETFLTINKPVLAHHAIECSFTKPDRAQLQGDAQRLEQLFTNLLQNTCRYTDSGGQLHVELHRTIVDGHEQLEIDWFDSSPGVAASALPQLFDPLFRTDGSRNRELGGSGLGLSIVKRIVEAHDGTISANNSSLGGLHINIRFPTNMRSL